MKCKNCGNELPENAMFCDLCGQKVENPHENETCLFCGNCGAKIQAGTEFCGECGCAVNGGNARIPMEQPKKNTWKIVVIILMCLCIAVGAAIFGYIIYSGTDEGSTDSDTSDKTQTASISTAVPAATAVPTETPIPTATPSETVDLDTSANNSIASRTDFYDSSLTYKRMPEIHNTVLTDDATFNALKSVILGFDAQCADYMNEITDAVPSYLKPGTTAYEQQTEYKQKHPTLNQSYQTIDVINARQGGGYYYVWVTEVLNVNENGVQKTTTDHWVYKIEDSGGRWYICDYTSDPAF